MQDLDSSHTFNANLRGIYQQSIDLSNPINCKNHPLYSKIQHEKFRYKNEEKLGQGGSKVIYSATYFA